MPVVSLPLRGAVIGAIALAGAGCAQGDATVSGLGLPPSPWITRATVEGRGEVRTLPDGRREAVRYKGWGTEDFGRFRTYAYGDSRPEPALGRVAMPAVAGDAKKGRSLFLSRALGPCTGC